MAEGLCTGLQIRLCRFESDSGLQFSIQALRKTMKTRIVKIKSGLGNQMFQYAYARERELLHGEKVLYDLYFFRSAQQRRKLKKVSHLKLYLADFNVNLPRISILGALFYRAFGKYYSGYPFGEFREIRKELIQEFSLKSPLPEIAKTIAKEKNSVAVHVRRGDFVGNKNVDTLSKDYFINAAKYMKEKLSAPKFFIFSDDIDWVKKNLKLERFGNVVFMDRTEPNIDMMISAGAKNHIIVNSTFAWWCAWLNKNPKKIVIAPRRWNTCESEHIKSSKMNLKEWIII